MIGTKQFTRVTTNLYKFMMEISTIAVDKTNI